MDAWAGCYDGGWKGEIVSEAFTHPAKYSRALIRHIYDHVTAEGWLVEGDTAIDPFGGVALGGLDAMRLGAHWVGVELEEKFVELGGQNIALWNSRYAGRFAKWGTARLVKGDSRRLLDVVREAGCCVSSPPFAEPSTRDRRDVQDGSVSEFLHRAGYTVDHQGNTPGNLAMLRADERGFAVAVGSPPYSETRIGRVESMRRKNDTDGDYGSSLGQLGAMPEGSLWDSAGKYGDEKGQLGTENGDSFWSAARVIVAQTYAALRPRGHAVFVVKSFVRSGKIVDFPGQWRQLCESVGFVTLHEHRASLVKENGTQLAVDGNHKVKRTERKSFFRRLHEKKHPGTEIDFEVVFCMEKGA